MASRSLELAQAISNTTGSGALVFAGGPTLLSPNVNVLYVNTAISNTGTISLNSNVIVSGNLSVNGSIVLPALTTTILDANAAFRQANAAYNQANTGTILAQSAFDRANNATDTWVRDAANSASSYANSAFVKANTATTNAATADQRAVTSGVYANAAYNQSNTATTNAATADQRAVTSGVYANAAYAFANTRYSATGGTISGDVSITGNLTILGNTVTQSSNDLVIDDPIILLANNNPGNLLDTGFVSHYVEGGITKHAGLVRHASSNTYYLFDSYVPHIQETNILDINEATLRITTLRANLVSDSVLVRGYDVLSRTNSAYAQANTATTSAASRVLRSGDAMTGPLSSNTNMYASALFANNEIYAGIATYSATIVPNLLGQFTGNSNTYIQVNEQNIDPQGTSDYVMTADVGTDTDFYVDLGITNSQYNNLYPNNSLGTSVSPLDGYLVVKGSSINQLGGNLVIGTVTSSPPTDVRVVVGGINSENIVSKFTQSGLDVYGTFTTTSNVTIAGYTRLTSNSAIKVPVGNTAQRSAGTKGDFRFNEESSQFEGYNGTVWGTVGGGATGGANNPVFYENDGLVTANYTITTGKNAMSAGPIEISDGVTVTVPDGSVWTIV